MNEEKASFDVTYLIVPVEDAAVQFNEVDTVTKALLSKAILMKSKDKYAVLVWDSRQKSGSIDENESNILMDTIERDCWERYLLINQGCNSDGWYTSIASGVNSEEIVRDTGLTVEYNIPAVAYSPSDSGKQ